MNGNYSQYQQFTQNLTFDQLKAAMAQVPPEMQQQLFGMLIPAAYTPGYSADNAILYTNRFRIMLDSQVAPNLSVTARLSMYKVFGDSAGVQVFNGQATSLNIDGTTAGVPNGDMLRVERAYFTWNNINDSKFFLSVGRRPSTGGPPLNLSEDEPRGGTPSGALINYQFDGITFGYKMSDETILRLCYGVGYESGFGSADTLKQPEDRIDDVHFLGANVDFWSTDKTLIQGTFARAFNVTDGFNGLTVLPNNPLTGEEIGAPVVMRFTPSTNLGDINLAGANVSHRFGPFDTIFSLNYVGFYPEPVTTPFGGLVSDPFDVPETHHGWMLLSGIRYNFGNDERSKIGFEYNHGSKYWFNFAQAEDEILAPKTSARGDVFEGYFTHRINDRFVFKADYVRYNYNWSGSGWHLGAPEGARRSADPRIPDLRDCADVHRWLDGALLGEVRDEHPLLTGSVRGDPGGGGFGRPRAGSSSLARELLRALRGNVHVSHLPRGGSEELLRVAALPMARQFAGHRELERPAARQDEHVQ